MEADTKSVAAAKQLVKVLCGEWDIRYIKDVVENGLCTYCGSCIALCDKISEGTEVADVSQCPGDCPTCVPCPRSELLKQDLEWKIFGKTREAETLGNFLEVHAAKTKDGKILEVGQDGGVVTTILKHALDEGIVDGVISVRGSEWKAEAYLARDFEELLIGACTKYTSAPSLVELTEAVIRKNLKNVAFVGTPCQIQGLRKIMDDPNYDIIGRRVGLVVGLFCMESYFHTMLDDVRKRLGVSLVDITKMDIKGKYLNISVKGRDEPEKIPLEDVKEFTRDACHFCVDFAGELADISVGSVGSPKGLSTVMTRTEAGKNVFGGAVKAGALESKPIEDDLEKVRKISWKKQKKNLENIAEKIPAMDIPVKGGFNLSRIYRVYRWRSD
jgi:coenzyme F420 hydrogenase subunit beta